PLLFFDEGLYGMEDSPGNTERGLTRGGCVLQMTPTQQDTPRWMGTFMSLHTWPYLMHVALLVALYEGIARLGPSLHIDFSYLFFPVLFWGALRFGPPGARAASAVVSSLAIWGTAHGGGPFVSGTFHE